MVLEFWFGGWIWGFFHKDPSQLGGNDLKNSQTYILRAWEGSWNPWSAMEPLIFWPLKQWLPGSFNSWPFYPLFGALTILRCYWFRGHAFLTIPQKKGHENLQNGQVTISFLSGRDLFPPQEKTTLKKQRSKVQNMLEYAGCIHQVIQSIRDPTWSHRVEVTIHHLKGSRFPHHKKVTIATWTPTKSIAGKCVSWRNRLKLAFSEM